MVILLIKINYNFFRSSIIIIVTFNRLLFLFLLINELATSD